MQQIPKEQINEVVAASVDGWCLFIATGLNSDFFKKASQFLDTKNAAQITLLHFYLSTFSEFERKRMLTDVDFFLTYADGFLREMLPYNKHNLQFIKESRRVFQKAMRQILSRHLKGISDAISYSDRREFMRGAMQLTASVDCIIQTWDYYKEFMSRKHPQLQHSVI